MSGVRCFRTQHPTPNTGHKNDTKHIHITTYQKNTYPHRKIFFDAKGRVSKADQSIGNTAAYF